MMTRFILDNELIHQMTLKVSIMVDILMMNMRVNNLMN